MHRIVILLSVFLITVAGMLYIQGDDTRNPADFASLGSQNIAFHNVSALSAPASLIVPIEASIGERALAAAEATPAPVLPAPAPRPAAVAAPVGDVSMRALTDGVLAELGIAPANAAENPDMASATARVLQGLRATPASGADTGGLSSLVAQALKQGQSDTYIDAMVNEAVAQGRVAVPQALRTSDGRVDTAILLSELVRAATGEDPTAPANGAVRSAGVEVRTVQQAGETVQYHFYTVQSGDSLGSIAHRFYGDASLYPQIFEANRRTLASPDQIRSGQRLTIPALPSA